jgi:tetratricopeptide (TPR) repeat protein
VASTLHEIALTHSLMGEFVRSLGCFEEVLRMQRADMPADHPAVSATLCNMGAAHACLGQHDQALTLFEDALRIARNALGPDRAHPDLATILTNMGASHRDAGRFAEAEDRLRTALKIHRDTLGTLHCYVGVDLYHLGGTLLEKGDRAGSLPLLEEAHRICAGAMNNRDHPMVKRSRAWLCRGEGLALRDRGRVGEATEKLGEALRLFNEDTDHGARHPRTRAVAAELASCSGGA